MKNTAIVGIAAAAALVGLAAHAQGWTFSAGPAIRTSVKSSISGAVPVKGVTPSHTRTSEAGPVETVADPAYAGERLYAATLTETETTVSSGGSSAGLSSDDRGVAVGARFNGGYDFAINDKFLIGANLRFAGYWNMRTSASGTGGGGTVSMQTTKDYFLYSNGPIPDDTDFSYCYPDETPYAPYRETGGSRTVLPAQRASASIRSDLYQIGLGPKFTYRPFGWLDVYAGAGLLCNIANMSMDSTAGSASDTSCLFGAYGEVGLAAYVTDWLGFYADFGYEWVDKASTSCGTLDADVDFSSCVFSAGVITRF